MDEFALEPLENFAVIDEISHATPEDIAAFRGQIVDPDERYGYYPEEDESEDGRDNRVNDATLRPMYSYSRGGGSKQKNRKKVVKPIRPLERIEKHMNIVKNTNREAYEPETDEQTATRQLLAFIKEMRRAEARAGRPRKGEEARIGTSGTADPADLAVLKQHGITPGQALDAIAAQLP